MLTSGNMTRGIFSVALPIMVANTFAVVMELANAFFLGRVGPDALAAVTMAGAVVFFIMTLGAGLGIGTIALVARAYGARDYRAGEHIGAQSLVLGFVLSLAIGAVGLLIAPGILGILGAQGEVHAAASRYLRIVFAGLPFMIFMFQAGAVFQGAGDTLTPTKISATATVLNIAMDPVFIFGLFGVPRLEVAGAAISSLIARSIGSLLMARVILGGRHAVTLTRASLRPDFGVMRRIFAIGFPGALQMMFRSSSFMAMTGIAAIFGPAVVAAFGVANRIFGVFLLPGFGFGAASSTLVGQNLGARRPARAERAALLTVAYYLLFVLAAGIPLFVFSHPVARFFNSEPEFAELTSIAIRFIAAGALFLAPGMVFSQALQGAGATVAPMVLTAVTLYAVQLPLAWWLAERAGMGATGIWTGSLVAGAVNAVLMAIVFFRGKWKSKRV